MLARVLADIRQIAEGDFFITAAVRNDVLQILWQLAKRCFNVKPVVSRQRLDELKIVGVAPVPAANRPAGQRQLRVGHHPVGVKKLLQTQAVTGLAGARRRSEEPTSELQS